MAVLGTMPDPVPAARVRPLAPSVKEDEVPDTRQLTIWNARSSSGLSDAPTEQHSYFARFASCSIPDDVNWRKRLMGRPPSNSNKKDVQRGRLRRVMTSWVEMMRI